jgi:hypothetical protein
MHEPTESLSNRFLGTWSFFSILQSGVILSKGLDVPFLAAKASFPSMWNYQRKDKRKD